MADNGGERCAWRTVTGPGARPSCQVVDVHRVAVDDDACLDETLSEHRCEPERRIAHRNGESHRLGSGRESAKDPQAETARLENGLERRRRIRRTGGDVARDGQIPRTRRHHQHRWRSRSRSGSERDPHRVTAEVQCAGERAVGIAKVVPRPGKSRKRLLGAVVVTDDPPRNAGDAAGVDGIDPAGEVRPARPLDCGIARSAGHQIAGEHAVRHRAAGPERAVERIVPPDRLDGGTQGDQLGDRRGDKQHVGVKFDDCFFAFQRPDRDAPDRTLDARPPHGVADVLEELLYWSEGRRDGWLGPPPRAAGQPDE